MHGSVFFFLVLLLPVIFEPFLPAAPAVPDDSFSDEAAALICDLDGNGVMGKIIFRRVGKDQEIGTFYQVVVLDAGGGIRWSSPAVMDTEDKLAFGRWEFGISMPQIAGDIDGDGKLEMIAPAPQSDVSPTWFRVFRWTGAAFQPLFSKALTGSGKAGARFEWTDKPQAAVDFWVQRWLGRSAEGGWLVDVCHYPGEGVPQTGIAVLVPENQGFKFLRWVHPPDAGRASGTEAKSSSLVYLARLSKEDHASSNGTALNKVSEILRQDRANYHGKRHRDTEDGDENRFATAEARTFFSIHATEVAGGEKVMRRIIEGTPVVRVEISDAAVRVTVISD